LGKQIVFIVYPQKIFIKGMVIWPRRSLNVLKKNEKGLLAEDQWSFFLEEIFRNGQKLGCLQQSYSEKQGFIRLTRY
jgi:hypothetical protein